MENSLDNDIMKVGDLIAQLLEYDANLPVMIAVVKYPEEFALRKNAHTGEVSWMDSTDVECIPLEHGEVTNQDDIITIAVELMDYDEQRHIAGG